MKYLITIVFAIGCSVGCVFAHSQVEHLKDAYKAQGDAFFVPLYWLPETRQAVLKHIPDHHDWVGFESGKWQKINDEVKLKLIDEIGIVFESFDGPKVEATWDRIRNWRKIASQLSLMSEFRGEEEVFIDLAYSDPLLRPAFRWITDRRPADFDAKFMGSTLSSGELTLFYPILIEHLLNADEQQRLECFARLFGLIAKSKAAKVKQDVEGGSH
jgi:hypothetical protein